MGKKRERLKCSKKFERENLKILALKKNLGKMKSRSFTSLRYFSWGYVCRNWLNIELKLIWDFIL
jgi:hypothetical protein